jgi:twitching motility protein PilT
MGDLIRDPELEKLISEVNVGDQPVAETPNDEPVAIDVAERLEVGDGEPVRYLLAEMVRRRASDLLLVPGSPPTVRVNGRLRPLPLDPLEPGQVEGLFAGHLGTRSRNLLVEEGTADFSLRLLPGEDDALGGSSGWRLRVNLQRQRGQLAAGIRLLPKRIPTLAELNLPRDLTRMVAPERGLVLVSGPTGSGKSTTLAALVDHLNRTEGRHVITIEDPVEYEHRSLHCLVEQVEVGTDTPSFSAALRAALRRDPDVILVGEMRDLETISTVLTAAETGHLILSTLHTADATRAINRVIDVFPVAQQDQVRQQLALGLHAVICQQLVPTVDGAGRVPALEVLVGTYPVRNHVRKQQAQHLYNEMMTGAGVGMVQMEASLADLALRGVIDRDEARCRANRPDELDRRLGG